MPLFWSKYGNKWSVWFGTYKADDWTQAIAYWEGAVDNETLLGKDANKFKTNWSKRISAGQQVGEKFKLRIIVTHTHTNSTLPQLDLMCKAGDTVKIQFHKPAADPALLKTNSKRQKDKRKVRRKNMLRKFDHYSHCFFAYHNGRAVGKGQWATKH